MKFVCKSVWNRASCIPMNSNNRSSVWCNINTHYKQTCCPLDIFPCPISWEVRSQHQVYCWVHLFELQVQAVNRVQCADHWQEPHTSCDYYSYPWNTHWHVSNILLFLFPLNLVTQLSSQDSSGGKSWSSVWNEQLSFAPKNLTWDLLNKKQEYCQPNHDIWWLNCKDKS
jgi:hypothetical protein